MSASRTLTLGFLCACIACGVSACTIEHGVSLAIEGASGAERTWEIRVYADACPALDVLANGPPNGVVHRQLFRGTRGEALPSLEGGTYCFAAIGRDAACAVTRMGTSVVTLGDPSEIAIAVVAPPFDANACAASLRCMDGECIGPSIDAPDGGRDGGTIIASCDSDGTTCSDPGTSEMSTCCDGTCVDVRTNPSHCGRCGNSCTATAGGGSRCVDGSCSGPIPSSELRVRAERVPAGTADAAVLVEWFDLDDAAAPAVIGYMGRLEIAGEVTGELTIPMSAIADPPMDYRHCASGSTDCPLAFARVRAVFTTDTGEDAIGWAPVVVAYYDPTTGADPMELSRFFTEGPVAGTHHYEISSAADATLRLPTMSVYTITPCEPSPSCPPPFP